MRKLIVFSIIVLLVGLSLLAIQCAPDNKTSPKGLTPGAEEQLKMPLKGLY